MRAEPEELEFGNFKILRRDTGELWELGKGGFGTTYKAKHTHLMRDCALKVINDNRVASEDARRRFLQEARAAASLQHPHIAAIYDFGEADGTFYYAMEYCAGGDLERYVESKGALSWAEVEPLAIQIASALSRAHQSGLLHRDLKPSNVMLSSENQPSPQLKLIDFGLVKVLDHQTTSSTHVMLTQEGAAGFNPLTASPEQLRDEDLDERSDLFSFGVTMLYLLCGGVPFGNVSAPLMMAQRLDDEPYDSILPSDLTGFGREVISRLLQKDREQRYRTADDVLAAIESATPVVTPSHDTASSMAIQDVNAAISDEIPQEFDWASAWEVKQIQQKCHSGSYYRCAGQQLGIPDVVMFMPSADSPNRDTILSYANTLVDVDARMLLSFSKAGYMDDERAYLCQPFMREGGRLLQLLQAQGNFTLQTHLALFQQLSQAIDEATELGLPGLELNAAMIIVDEGEMPKDGIPESSDDWLEYYQTQISKNSSFARAVSLCILPKLEDPSDDDDIQATVTLEDLATDPITKFGSLIYRSISGMSVRPAAYLRESGYVSTSNLGEESNRFLAEIIVGRSEVSSATEIIIRLCEYEGVSWEVEVLEGHISTRLDESQQFTKKIGGLDQLISEALETEKRERREREESERREAKDRKQRRVAEEKARAEAAAEELRRKEEDVKAAAEAERLRLEEQVRRKTEEEAKTAAEAKKQKVEEEARKKKEAELKAVADAEKASFAEEKAAKLKKEQEQQEAKTRAEETKLQQEIREKHKELERIAAEKEKLQKQEAEALAVSKALKLAEQQEKKDKEKQARKEAEDEKKIIKLARKLEEEEKRKKAALAKAEAKKKEQADQERLKVQQEKRNADEVKRKVEVGNRSLANARVETGRLQREALAAHKLAEKENKKIEQEQKGITQQQQGAAVSSKKKPIVIAAAALILGILAFVGIKSFSGDRDKGGDPKPQTSDMDGGKDNTNTKDSVAMGSGGKDPRAVKLVAEKTPCVVIIPLSDGGKGIPDDVEMELVASDGGGYGTLTKSSGGLKATLTGESPPKDEKFKVKFKNKNYTLESDVKFRSDQFEETDPGVYSYKLNVQLNVRAQFYIVPSLKPQLAQYIKPLLELLKTRGQLKILNDSGTEIKEARAFYDKSSEKIRIVMPAGRSFNRGNVKLQIDWPYFESLNLEVGNNGLVDNKPWEIKLKKYDLDLSLLKDRMPRFERVGFIPTFGDGIGAGLREAINALLEGEQVSYLKKYKDIKGENDVLVVPSQEGSLVFSGGVIQDEGILIKNGVKRGQLVSSFLGFPKGLYVAALPIPFRNNNPQEKGGGYIYTAIPSMVAIHLQDRQEGVPHPFEFRVTIEVNLEMKQYLTTLKLKSWNQRTNQWTLSSVTGAQQDLNLILIVSRASDGSLNVDYTDIVVNGENKYKFDPVAKTKWGMSIEPKEGGVIHQKLTMKFISRSEDAKSFIQNLESNYALSRKDFEDLKDRYNTPENYPAFTKSIFRKLGE